MSFTERLFKETHESHKIVDKHPFVSLIKDNLLASDLYINFNKICIYEIQKYLKLNDNDLQNRLHKNVVFPEKILSQFPSLNTLLTQCKTYPLETEYMFKLGLLKGGNLLKKYVHPSHYDFLTFTNPTTLCNDFKHYLNTNVPQSEQESFIKHVNQTYNLIKLCFDDFSINS